MHLDVNLAKKLLDLNKINHVLRLFTFEDMLYYDILFVLWIGNEWLVGGNEFFMIHMFCDKEMDYVGVQYAQNNGYLHTN